MATFTLPLDPIANIMVNLSARSAVRKAFNLALLMGDVPDDVEFGSVRIKTYANTTEMLQDGFTKMIVCTKLPSLFSVKIRNLR